MNKVVDDILLPAFLTNLGLDECGSILLLGMQGDSCLKSFSFEHYSSFWSFLK